MISGLAPGKAACTSRVGNSTSGSGETGKNWYAVKPARASAMVSSVVPMGRWMNRAEKFMRPPHACQGSDVHVMLALCRSSRQVVVADEQLDGPDMVGQLLGKRQRVADQPGHALPQRVVEPFDVIGFARELADGLVLRRRNHFLIDHILIRVKRGVVPVGWRNLGPQVLATRVAAIAHVKRNDLAGLGIHSDPDPLLVR